MKSLAKLIGLVVFGVVVLAVGILFFLTRMFDPNDYKEHIQQAARDKASVELTLGGDIGWSLFPWLGIELKDVGVAPLHDPDQPLAQVGSLGLGVEVLPLLRRQLRMSDVILDSVSLNLIKDADGKGNWESIGQPAESPARAPQPSTEAEPPARQPAPQTTAGELDISIESVRITNARIHYEDRQSSERLQFEDVNLSTGALVEGQPFDLAFLGLMLTEQPVMRTRIDLKGVAQFDLGLKRYQLEALNLKIDASGEPFSGRAVSLQLQGDALVDLAAQVAELNQMRLSLADMRATGQLRASELDKALKLGGQLDVAEFNARELLRSLGQDVPETAEPRALEKVALTARLNGSSNSLMLEQLKLVLDGTELSGSLGVADFERQALRFQLAGNQLNIDNYLPPSEKTTTSTAPAGRPGGSSSTAEPEPWSDEPVLPLELLARLDVDGSLDLQQVRLTELDIAPFKAAVVARNGRVRLNNLEGGVFGGQFKASAEIDTRQTPVSLSVSKQLTGMDSLAVQRAYEVAEQFRGRLDLNLEARSSGNSIKRWIETMNGNARFSVSDGALLGVNLEQQLCRAIALANRRSLSEAHGSEDTPFRSLNGSFRIVSGKVSGDDLVAALPGIQVKGRGDIDLPPQRLDYRLGLLLEGDTREMPDPACQVNQRYVGIEWPVRCRGYLHNAASSCNVDTDGVAQIAARLVGSEAQRKVEERLQERLGDQAPAVRETIRGLFNR